MSGGLVPTARPVRVLSSADVARVLDPDRLVEAMEHAMCAIASGQLSMPRRVLVDAAENRGRMVVMAAHRYGASTFTAKVATRFLAGSPEAAHQRRSVLVVFDAYAGDPVAIVDGPLLTTLRTAATSRLAIRHLANPEAHIAAVLGAGDQARAHADAVLRERAISELRIVDRDGAMARELGRELADKTQARIVFPHSYEQALLGAHVVCAATASPEPVVRREWLTEGVHVNSVGFSPHGREVAPEVVRDARVVVDDRNASLAPGPIGANDITFAIRDGVIQPDGVHAVLGEVIMDPGRGRTDRDQITLYKSVGVAAQDDAAVELALTVARDAGVGTVIHL